MRYDIGSASNAISAQIFKPLPAILIDKTMTYEEAFKEIDSIKDKYRISNILVQLSRIEPNYEFVEKLKKSSNHRTSQIRWKGLTLLANFNYPYLEEFFVDIIKSDKDNFTTSYSIKGLGLNGKEESIEFLIDFFKKSKDGQVKGIIITALRSIYLRCELTEITKEKLFDFIGNKYPFFQGFWNDIKKAKYTTISKWQDVAVVQLSKNNLNFVFELNNEIDIHINIEKMKSNFIRSINATAIYKNHKSSFTKHFTPNEFYICVNKLFNNLLRNSKEMRPDSFVKDIIQLIENDLISQLCDKIHIMESFKTISFEEIELNGTKIFHKLFDMPSDFFVPIVMTPYIDIFNTNKDKNEFIDYIIKLWRDTDRETYCIINYLEEKKQLVTTNLYYNG